MTVEMSWTTGKLPLKTGGSGQESTIGTRAQKGLVTRN